MGVVEWNDDINRIYHWRILEVAIESSSEWDLNRRHKIGTIYLQPWVKRISQSSGKCVVLLWTFFLHKI